MCLYVNVVFAFLLINKFPGTLDMANCGRRN